VRFASDRRLQVLARGADRKIGRRIPDHREVVEMPVRMAGLAFRGGAEDRGHIVLALDIRLVGEIEVAPVRLGFAGESGLEVVVGLGAFERFHSCLLEKSEIETYVRRTSGWE
jgi:hypothetical protein